MDGTEQIRNLLAAATSSRKLIEMEATTLQTQMAQIQQRLNELARAHDRVSSAEEAYKNALTAISQADSLPETTTSPIIESYKETKGSKADQ